MKCILCKLFRLLFGKLYFRLHHIVTILVFLLYTYITGCQRNDPAIQSGDIQAIVNLYDDNSMPVADRSGIRVEIRQDNQSYQTVTDMEGKFSLSDIPIGKYEISLEKPGFLMTNRYTYSELPYNEFYQEGGPADTVLQYDMYSIPRYIFHLDSGDFVSSSIITVLCTGPDLSKISESNYYYYKAVCFFDSTREVSRDHFLIYTYGTFSSFPKEYFPYTDQPYFKSAYPEFGQNFDSYHKDSIYIRLYPVTMGEETYAPLRLESLGGASNVIGIYFPKTDSFP